ncbi:MAG TPA: dihydroneopterin aldolase [Terriglobia bacterium]|nr:dihydroneopterin aldolase [Terriglobia bacterium]
MDRILLQDIRFLIGVGVTEEERSRPQLCRLDVILKTDLSGAGATGTLSQGVDYAVVFRLLEELCTGRSFRLLEEIAHQASQLLLDRFPLRAITFRIRKLQPFTDKVGAVGIQITRKRNKP